MLQHSGAKASFRPSGPSTFGGAPKVIRILALWAIVSLGPVRGQAAPETILQVDLDNWVLYDYDFMDYTKMATDPNKTTPLPMRAFGRHLTIADIVFVNGKPAKGTCVYYSRMLGMRPNAGPGSPIADVSRAMLDDFGCEFLQADGMPVGSIFGYGFTHGAAPPGAPRAVTTYSLAVTGGTGAYLGARGQKGFIGPVPSRGASVYEDPVNRRVHGGTKNRFVLHLVPMDRPEVTMVGDTPGVLHSSDFSLVTQERPARPGEVLIARARGFGPVRMPIDPGQPFPVDPVALVNSPVEVIVNGQSAEMINLLGWPGTTNEYRVDFRVPEGASAGTITVQLIAAWVLGPEVRIPVR